MLNLKLNIQIMSDYPLGAKYDSDAPYNQVNKEGKELEVMVSITMHKSFKIKVYDYDIERAKDEDGNYYESIDFSSCNLKEATLNQVILPYVADKFIEPTSKRTMQAIDNLQNWSVDELEIIEE